MEDNAREIERHIDERRSRLNKDISELEQKAQDVFDWRTQMERHPGTMLGLAFGAGLLLSAALPGASSRPSRQTRYAAGEEEETAHGPWVSSAEDEAAGRRWTDRRTEPRDAPRNAPRNAARTETRSAPQNTALNEAAQGAWDKIKEALLAAALVKFEGVVREVLPEFTIGENKTESRRATGETGYPGQTVH